MANNIRVFFAKSEETDEEHELMQQAYQACKQDKINTLWVRDIEIENQDLKKTDVVVFKDFTGKNFDQIISKKSAVLGPLALIVCLSEAKKIPPFLWPILNVALYNCVITSSHLSTNAKKSLGDKVLLMGGMYEPNFSNQTTHVVVDSVKSAKYMKAAELGVKIMKPQWIDALWAVSLDCNIHGDDDMFEKYKCPPFHKLVISATGMNVSIKDEIERLVIEQGGCFSSTMDLRKTDFLICGGKDPTLTNKYKAAMKTQNIHCVTIEWLHDSIRNGYCLPYEKYCLGKRTSTPTREFVDPNFSTLSAINTCGKNVSKIDDTQQFQSTSREKRKVQTEFEDKIEKIDVKRVKRCENFLDGCSVYLVGFTGEMRDKLCRIVNACGATRLDDMSDRITHVIVGDNNCDEFKLIQSKKYPCSIVDSEWLFDSIRNEKACNEESYLINTQMELSKNAQSPIGCKGLSLLRSNKMITELDLTENSSEKLTTTMSDDDTIANYLKNANFESAQLRNDENDGTLTPSSDKSSETLIFNKMKFFLLGFDDEDLNELIECITKACGSITNDPDLADIIVTPSFTTSPFEKYNEKILNDHWIFNAIQENSLVDIAYFHRSYVIKNSKALDGCVITMSGYEGYEREFLGALIRQLSGVCQEQFSKKCIVEQNVFVSTHLITSNMDGKKYQAAVRWKVPTVTRTWLMKCTEEGRKVPEDDYKVTEQLLLQERNTRIEMSVSSMSKWDKENLESIDSNGSSLKYAETGSKTRIPDDSKLSGITSTSAFEQPEETLVSTPGNSNSSNFENGTSSILEKIKLTQRNNGEDICSQVTPVKKIMKEVRKTNLLGTPETPNVGKASWDIDTPETPYGICFTPNPSRSFRKELIRRVNQLPDFIQPKERRMSTPFSELKRQLAAKISESIRSRECNQEESNDENAQLQESEDTESEYQTSLINSKLEHLEKQMLAHATNSGNRSSRRTLNYRDEIESSKGNVQNQESQPCTVQWDFGKDTQEEVHVETPRVFIISGVVDPETREKLENGIVNLGGVLLNSFDENVTHLLCSVPGRNEKTLCCMASGKWILHFNYIEASIEEGRFLNEEEYEFGNPSSMGKIPIELNSDVEARMQAIHHWRREIDRTHRRPFTDMRFIVLLEQNKSLVKVIKTGGGTVLEERSFFRQATHCLLDEKNYNDNNKLVESLAKKNIPCLNIFFISDYLHRNCKEEKNYIIPQLKNYYK